MSSDKQLPSKIVPDRQVSLHDNGLRAGSLIDASISRLSHDQIAKLAEKAGEKAIELEAKRREQELDQYQGQRALNDHLDAFNARDKSGRTTRHTVTSEIKTGAGKMHLESKSGATCFVATATYGDSEHPNVIFLREFRDTRLRDYEIGRRFIDFYWKIGPKLAVYVVRNRFYRYVSRLVISGLVYLLRSVVKS